MNVCCRRRVAWIGVKKIWYYVTVVVVGVVVVAVVCQERLVDAYEQKQSSSSHRIASAKQGLFRAMLLASEEKKKPGEQEKEEEMDKRQRVFQRLKIMNGVRKDLPYFVETPDVDKPLTPPFPNGLNSGRLHTLPPELHYHIDPNAHLLPPRPIQVWLPPHYDLYPELNFPVLYCHDGQNAMDDDTSWTGSSWRLMGALTRLSERRMLRHPFILTDDIDDPRRHVPPIVVLLPSAPTNDFRRLRHFEYGDASQSFSRAHVDFVAHTLKRLIDSTYRTHVSAEGNCVIGTSLGGQAALHLLLRHDDKFGGAACLSPAFQRGTVALAATKLSSASQTLKRNEWRGKRIYLDNGGDERETRVPLFDMLDHFTTHHWWNPGYWWLDTQLQPGIDAMRAASDWQGMVNYDYRKIPGGRHNERGWANRIHLPLLHLYNQPTTTTTTYE